MPMRNLVHGVGQQVLAHGRCRIYPTDTTNKCRIHPTDFRNQCQKWHASNADVAHPYLGNECIYSSQRLLSNQVLMFCCRKCFDGESKEMQRHQPSYNGILKLVISTIYQL